MAFFGAGLVAYLALLTESSLRTAADLTATTAASLALSGPEAFLQDFGFSTILTQHEMQSYNCVLRRD